MNLQKKLLIGNFGAKNLGDELILLASLAKTKNSIVMTNDVEYSQKFCMQNFENVSFFPVGFRSFWKFFCNSSYRKKIFLLKNEIDEIIFCGGGLFAIRFKAVWIWFIIFLWAKYFLKKPVFFIRQGIDQNLGFFSQKIIQFVFSRADYISVRDSESAEILKKLKIKNVEIKNDAVIQYLKNNFEKNFIPKEKIILINAKSFFDPKKILKKYPQHKLIFIAFDPQDKKFVPKNFNHEILFPADKNQLFEIFQKAEISIGERLHFLILGENFCGKEKTFLLKKPYSEKVKNFSQKRFIKIL